MSLRIEDIKERVKKTPIASGGANFRTHVLRIENSRLSYKPTMQGTVFNLVILIIGLGILLFSFYKFSFHFIPFIVGSLFSIVGGHFIYTTYKPRVFDKQQGIFYKSYKPNLSKTNIIKDNSVILLQDIIALQIIGEHVSNRNGTYGSFELNLVLNDTSRINIIDHKVLKSIINDAYEISQFLDIPIWNAETSSDSDQIEFKA